MGQIQYTISLVMIALFTFAIIGFVTNFATENNAAVDINDDDLITGLYSETNANLSAFRTNAESTSTSIVTSSLQEGSDTTPTGAPFTITPTNAMSTTNNIMKVGWAKIFGNDPGFGIFITTLIGILIFVSAMFIWKTWAGRTPD